MSLLEATSNLSTDKIFEIDDTEEFEFGNEIKREREEFGEYQTTSDENESLEKSLKEVERLKFQQELLKNKVSELKDQLSKTGVKKRLKETYRLRISNAEQKQKMLEKRIASEKTRALSDHESGCTRKTGQNLSKLDKKGLFYINSLTSSDVLERKTTYSPHRLFRAENSRESFRKTLEIYPESKDLGTYGMWQRLDAGKDRCIIDGYRYIIPREPKPTYFFPPIPAPDAKKRPRDKPHTETRRRLIPNSKRLASNRVFLYEKQLEFAMKYDLETKDIFERLIENEDLLEKKSKDSCVKSQNSEIWRQQLYLMGALSKEFLKNTGAL